MTKDIKPSSQRNMPDHHTAKTFELFGAVANDQRENEWIQPNTDMRLAMLLRRWDTMPANSDRETQRFHLEDKIRAQVPEALYMLEGDAPLLVMPAQAHNKRNDVRNLKGASLFSSPWPLYSPSTLWDHAAIYHASPERQRAFYIFRRRYVLENYTDLNVYHKRLVSDLAIEQEDIAGYVAARFVEICWPAAIGGPTNNDTVCNANSEAHANLVQEAVHLIKTELDSDNAAGNVAWVDEDFWWSDTDYTSSGGTNEDARSRLGSESAESYHSNVFTGSDHSINSTISASLPGGAAKGVTSLRQLLPVFKQLVYVIWAITSTPLVVSAKLIIACIKNLQQRLIIAKPLLLISYIITSILGFFIICLLLLSFFVFSCRILFWLAIILVQQLPIVYDLFPWCFHALSKGMNVANLLSTAMGDGVDMAFEWMSGAVEFLSLQSDWVFNSAAISDIFSSVRGTFTASFAAINATAFYLLLWPSPPSVSPSPSMPQVSALSFDADTSTFMFNLSSTISDIEKLNTIGIELHPVAAFLHITTERLLVASTLIQSSSLPEKHVLMHAYAQLIMNLETSEEHFTDVQVAGENTIFIAQLHFRNTKSELELLTADADATYNILSLKIWLYYSSFLLGNMWSGLWIWDIHATQREGIRAAASSFYSCLVKLERQLSQLNTKVETTLHTLKLARENLGNLEALRLEVGDKISDEAKGLDAKSARPWLHWSTVGLTEIEDKTRRNLKRQEEVLRRVETLNDVALVRLAAAKVMIDTTKTNLRATLMGLQNVIEHNRKFQVHFSKLNEGDDNRNHNYILGRKSRTHFRQAVSSPMREIGIQIADVMGALEKLKMFGKTRAESKARIDNMIQQGYIECEDHESGWENCLLGFLDGFNAVKEMAGGAA